MITVKVLRDTISSLGYKWFEDQPNLIGIRTNLQVPDVFNDLLFIVWKQRSMPENLSSKDKQAWLNANMFTDGKNKKLDEDGDFGTKSQEALAKYNASVGKDRIFSATITTEPGVAYQKKLLNPKGCWVMMPAQMINAYKAGLHQGKADHRCLKSVGRIFGLRDNDLNGIAGDDKDAICEWADGTLIGANIHGANKAGITSKIGPWSAGCQVHNDWNKKEEMMQIIDCFKDVNNGLVTYTLIKESNLKL